MLIKEQTDNVLEYYNVIIDKLSDNCKNFAFTFECVLREDIMDGFPEMVKISADDKPGDVLSFTETNKDCKLNGYRERWIYSCDCNDY